MMITLIQNRGFNEPYPGHIVTVKKPIGNFPVGQRLHITIQKMEGRIYQPGKNPDGTWIDKVGKPDNRYMIFNSENYAVATKEQMDESFDEN